MKEYPLDVRGIILHVYDNNGELIVDKKFYKAGFGEIIDNPEYGRYVDLLLEKAMIRKHHDDEPDIDIESYEEVKAIHDEIVETHEDAFKELS